MALPVASKYADYREAAAKSMLASKDADVRDAGKRLAAAGSGSGWIATGVAKTVVKKRLTAINTATAEAAELRAALTNLEAMLYVEKSSHVGEHKVPGGAIRNSNDLQIVLEREMIAAGATKDTAETMAFVMAWAAFGESLDRLIRAHPWVFSGMPHQTKLVTQWLDRAKRLRSGR